MTETEWLACTDPQPMLEFLRGKASDRKLRLFAVACCRRIWQLLTDERSRGAVEWTENAIDGVIGGLLWHEVAAAAFAAFDEEHVAFPQRLVRAARSTLGRVDSPGERAAYLVLVDDVCQYVPFVARLACEAVKNHRTLTWGWKFEWPGDVERKAQAPLLRCIVGPLPFRPILSNPSWLTPAVMGLAESTYQERAFDRLPILADALEDAGCTNPDILDHCRLSGEHARGCWVVDLILAKH